MSEAATAEAEVKTEQQEEVAQPQQATIIPKGEMHEQIIKADHDYKNAKQTVRNVQEMIDDELAEMTSFQEFKKAEEALARAKENLRIASLSNANLNNLKEQLAEEKANRKLRKDVLSGLLVRYSADFRVRTIRTDEDIDDTYREIVLTGRIGRKQQEQVELAL